MRELHVSCEKGKFKNELPVFPPRKLFGSTDESFIQKRKKELENYYNTLLKSVNIDELPEILHFLNTNKPNKKTSKSPVITNVEHHSPAKQDTRKDKQQELKRAFEKIVTKYFDEMEENTEYENEIEDETRRKFNQEFQKLKLDLKSPLLDQVVLPKGDRDNDTDFWSAFFHDSHEDSVKKLEKVTVEIDHILAEQNKCSFQFVVSL
jgi:hypothetical protein